MKLLSIIKGALLPLFPHWGNSPARIQTSGLLFLMIFALALPVKAEQFNSIDVFNSGVTSNASCLDLDIDGICIHFYIKCSLFGGCRVKTRTVALISHNLPDLVVTAFREQGETPYTEIRNTISIPAAAAVSVLMGESASGGYSPMTTSQALTFNEVNVIGSPASARVRTILTARSAVGFLCETNVVPLRPYFMSELDAIAWRHAELNIRAESLTPGQREIGDNFLRTWGSVHPRVGFVMQNQPPKAAAVVSQRAIDIVSKTNQRPHIYSPYPIDGNPETRASWQMIRPARSSSCEQFGADGEWSEGKQSTNDDGDFAWNYWTRQDCCGPEPRWTFYTQTIRF